MQVDNYTIFADADIKINRLILQKPAICPQNPVLLPPGLPGIDTCRPEPDNASGFTRPSGFAGQRLYTSHGYGCGFYKHLILA